MNVLVLHDVPLSSEGERASKEWDQVEVVEKSLITLGHCPYLQYSGMNLNTVKRTLENVAPDLVINLVERVNGSSRLAHICPAILESIGVPYTGCGVYSSFITGNQLRTKEMLGFIEAPTPRWHTEDSLANQSDALEGRFILKPVFEHGLESIDEWSVVTVSSRNQLTEKLIDRHSNTGSLFFAEEYVSGRDISVYLVGENGFPVILLPAERVKSPGSQKQSNRSGDGDTGGVAISYRFDFSMAEIPAVNRIKHLASSCWSLFEMSGYARIDFRISEAGMPYVIDVTPNPSLVLGEGLSASSECLGFEHASLVELIMKAALPGK